MRGSKESEDTVEWEAMKGWKNGWSKRKEG